MRSPFQPGMFFCVLTMSAFDYRMVHTDHSRDRGGCLIIGGLSRLISEKFRELCMSAQSTSVFISYSHEDARYLEALRTMLAPLVRPAPASTRPVTTAATPSCRPTAGTRLVQMKQGPSNVAWPAPAVWTHQCRNNNGRYGTRSTTFFAVVISSSVGELRFSSIHPLLALAPSCQIRGSVHTGGAARVTFDRPRPTAL